MFKSIFKEKYLIFKGVKPLSLFDPRKSPSEFNAEAVNPSESIANFEQAESAWAAKAWQHPIKDAITDNVKDLKEIVHATLYPAQAGLNIVKSITTETSEAVTNLLSKYIANPVKIVARTAASPIAFIFNNIKRAADAIIKYPFSALNILGSNIGRPPLAVSSLAQKSVEKIKEAGESVNKKLSSITSGLRSKIDDLKIPGLDKLQTQGI